MKQIVQTTGNFMLVEPSTREVVESSRPCVVSKTSFFAERIGLNQLSSLGEVPDEASDIEFRDYWRDCGKDADMAVSSYIAKFQPEAEEEPEEPKRQTRKRSS